ncbi:MAG: cytochrome P450 [Gammaproteobacteria bacterium]|nr:cytochrome P450 [Gammaproteobacteria bacterium]
MPARDAGLPLQGLLHRGRQERDALALRRAPAAAVLPDPERFDPHRPEPENVFAYIPFGGGQRKCVGNAFALLQVKTIFGTLLKEFEFELAGPPGEYREIMPSLILRPSDPCVLRYRRRKH